MKSLYKNENGFIYLKDNKLNIKITDMDIQKKILFYLENENKLYKLKKELLDNRKYIRKNVLDLYNISEKDGIIYKKYNIYKNLLKKMNDYNKDILTAIKHLYNKMEEIHEDSNYLMESSKFIRKFKLKEDKIMKKKKKKKGANFEKEIYNYLIKFDFDFILEQVPINIRRINNLIPDFVAVKKINNKFKILVIEADGRQHYDKKYYLYNKRVEESDEIKEMYIKECNISLFRVTEDNYDLLPNLIKLFLNSEKQLYYGCYNINNNCNTSYNLKVL